MGRRGYLTACGIAVLVLGGCASSTPSDEQVAAPTSLEAASRAGAECELAGTLLARATTEPGSDKQMPVKTLVRIDPCSWQWERVLPASEVDAVAASDGSVYVSGLLAVRAGSSVPLSGAARLVGESLQPIGPKGVPLFVQGAATGGGAFLVTGGGDPTRVIKHVDGEDRVVFRAADKATMVWSVAQDDDGVITAVVEDLEGHDGYVLVKGLGSEQPERVVPIPEMEAPSLISSPGKPYLVRSAPWEDDILSYVVASDTLEFQEAIPGWWALAWSPDGSRVLYSRPDGSVGLARSEALADVDVIGVFELGAIFDVVWLDQ